MILVLVLIQQLVLPVPFWRRFFGSGIGTGSSVGSSSSGAGVGSGAGTGLVLALVSELVLVLVLVLVLALVLHQALFLVLVSALVLALALHHSLFLFSAYSLVQLFLYLLDSEVSFHFLQQLSLRCLPYFPLYLFGHFISLCWYYRYDAVTVSGSMTFSPSIITIEIFS